MSCKQLQTNVLILLAMFACLVLCACSTVQTRDLGLIPPLKGHPARELPADDLTEISPEMAAFVEQHAPQSLITGRRAFNLAVATVDKNIMGFNYDASLTLPPAETFRRRTGNCMSFALMLVAMARHAGVDAHFEEVRVDPIWRTNEETYINIKHINVIVGRNEDQYIVDVSGDVLGNQITSRRLTDQEAAAQYYNNLGIDALLDNDLPSALARLKQALEIDPNQAFLWSNLGVIYSRAGQLEDAEWAYLAALEMNSTETVAASNLHLIYERQGRYKEAEALARKVERHRRRNPYYLARLANEALDRQEYQDAIRLLRKSIRMKEEEYRFYGAMAQAQYLAGNHEEAMDNLDIARSLAPPAALAELESLPLSGYPQ